MPRRSQTPYLSPERLIAEFKRAADDLNVIVRSFLPKRGTSLSLVLYTLLGVNLLTLLAPSAVLCQADALRGGELWRLALAPWVLPRSGSLWPLLLLLFISYQASGLASGHLKSARPFWRAGLAWLALSALNLLTGGLTWSLVMSGAMWCWFGEPLSRVSPSSRSKLQRGLVISTCAGLLGGGLYLTLLSSSGDLFMGDHIMIRPLLAAWGYRIGPHAVPLINVRGYNLKWVVLAFSLFESLLMPSATTAAGFIATLSLSVWWEGGPRALFAQLTGKR